MNLSSRTLPLAEIMRRLRGVMPDLRVRYGVTALSAFGSQVRGTAGARSDLDLLVEFDRPPGFFQFVALEEELSELLRIKVDLVMKSALRPHIGQHVVANALPVS
ncbi:MAG: nucleotidyltransferase family protein [Opitutaceae bacterium]|nr:nucleotidyltransferase family protein [Opitutaceae bacterium]